MRVIHKFRIFDGLIINGNPDPIHIDSDPGDNISPYVWVERSEGNYDNARLDARLELTYKGTGQQPADGPWFHIGSCRVGVFVWHVYGRYL